MQRLVRIAAGIVLGWSVSALAQDPGEEAAPGSDLLAKLQTIDLSSPDMAVNQTPPPPPPPDLATTTQGTAAEWEGLKNELGLHEGWNADKKLLVASQAVVVGSKPGEPNFIASRIIAFEKAEMQAKADLAQFLASTLSGKSELKVFEGPENQEAAKDIQEASGKQMAVEEFQSELNQTATGMLVGAQVLATFEAPVEGGYEVRAVVGWSENLKRLANTFVNVSEYKLKLKGTGKPLKEVIPCETPDALVNRFGCKIYVDETGKMIAVAYGQADARAINPARAGAAVARAQGKAKLSALAALRRFLNEEASLSRRFAEREKIVEREGQENVEQILESLYSAEFRSASEAIDVSGASSFCNWQAKHPVTGQDVVGAVMTLSSDAQKAASGMKQSMLGGETEEPEDATSDEGKDSNPW
jgi:autotransporter translocation and assembly factor TamB